MQMSPQSLGSPYQNHGTTVLTKILTTSSILKSGWAMKIEKIILSLHKLSIQWWKLVLAVPIGIWGLVFT